MKKRVLAILLIVVNCLFLTAQEISNLRVQQEGRDIMIYYDLSAKANVKLNIKIWDKRIKAKKLLGDIGKNVGEGKHKQIVWQVFNENNPKFRNHYLRNGKFQASNVVFSVKAYAPWRAFVIAEGGLSPKPMQYSAGLMVGAVARVGFYAKARSSFQFAQSESFIDIEGENALFSNGTTMPKDALPYYLNGKKKPMQWIANAGIVVRVLHKHNTMLYLYGGAGYGVRQQLWQTTDGKWMNYQPTTYKGISGDLGLMVAYKNVVFSVGGTTIAFKYGEMEVGIGWIL